ncbi:unnamed protein product [Sphenostylis stenocarpa]|uniref:Wall-associated receptor kinase C-terminal domain-containing protein n=1 Tax=Sphenostylis stenocarpa TaxID=92480 RepID=A0AA86SJ72_9FABA|nr:unnamed protein product [Sphenostylis stenocarpa]
MGVKHGDFHNTLLPFLLIVSCLMLISFPHSHSQPPSPTCSQQSYTCSINVSAIFYPFWEHNPQCTGGDQSQLFCYAQYGKNIQNYYPEFTVKEFNDTSRTMKVMLTNPVNNDVCYHQFFDIYKNLNKTLFQYSASVHNITIFFDSCPDHIPGFPSMRSFKCGDSVHYFEEGYKEQKMLQKYSLLNDCKQRLRVPTPAPLHNYYYSDGDAVLREVISDGFEVYYDVPQHCRRCSETDGSCLKDGNREHCWEKYAESSHMVRSVKVK